MKSPFKFLDSFTLRDKDAFFGREAETNRLYQMVFESPVQLIYGLSGTGKTSLIQCGLASKFDGPDWFPFFIRRGDDINAALHESLNSYLPEERQRAMSLPDKVSELFRDYLSPVYLIFDQLEELYILGDSEEQRQFAKSLRELLDAELPCRVMLVMREEYLGYLYELEQHIPYLFDFRLRVEPMNRQNLMHVMGASFEQFNIGLEPPKEKRLEEMLRNISGEKSGVQLPYLQVYLDLLYRECYAETYPDQVPESPLPPLTFRHSDIERAGSIENVLERFVQEQESALQYKLTQQFEGLPDDAVRRTLDALVTREGTKRPVHFHREGELLLPEAAFCELTPFLTKEARSFLLEELERRRILRAAGEVAELAHDSIAAIIDQNRTEQQRQINQIYRRLKHSFEEYKDNEVFLTERQLNVLEEYLPLLTLDAEVEQFIAASHEEVARLRQEAEEKKRARLRKRLFPLIVSLAVVAILLSFYAFDQKGEAERAQRELTRQTIQFDLKSSQSLAEGGNYNAAKARLSEALKVIKGNELGNEYLDTLEFISQQLKAFDEVAELVQNADDLVKKDTTDLTDTLKLPALKNYEKALSIVVDSVTNLKKENLLAGLKKDAEIWYDRAQNYAEFDSPELARQALQYARRLDPTRVDRITALEQMLK